jgi:Rod binding domain-containing protein
MLSTINNQLPTPKDPAIIGNLPSRKKAWNAAKRFEGIFVGMLIRDMRKSSESLGEGMFGKAPGSGVQSQLFNSLLSDKMAQSGRIGLAKTLMEDWERQRLIPKEAPLSHVPQTNLGFHSPKKGMEMDNVSKKELKNE